MTTFLVTSTDDTADTGTLRWAIEQANDSAGADVIAFDASFQTPRTIVLGGTALPTLDDASGPTFISGPGADLLTISGSQASRILVIAANQIALIDGLTLTQGLAGDEQAGGAISNDGVLTISNSIISNSSGYWGGAVASHGALTARHVQFRDNMSDAGGGAIYGQGAVTVEFCVFEGNTASTEHGDGGGIYQVSNQFDKPSLSVSNSTFENNVASRGGGISNYGFATIYGATFNGNDGYRGGAVHNHASMVVFNSTFVANHAVLGGAIDNFYGSAIDVNSVTITENTASDEGAGIWQGFSQNFSLTNSLVAANLRNGVPDDIFGDLDDLNIFNNLFTRSDTTAQFEGVNDNLVLDADDDLGLGPLANNGGFTQTMALQLGSPAIDQGFLGLGPLFYPEFDQRGVGFRRAMGTRLDIGAVESNFAATPILASENQTYVMNLLDNGPANFPYTFAVTGGIDQAAFEIYQNYPTTLNFVTSPDFENPHDLDHDNVYHVQVTVTDRLGQTTVQDLSITVEDVNEPPVFTFNSEALTYDGGGTLLVDSEAVFTPEVGATDFSNARLYTGLYTENRGPYDRVTLVSQGKKAGQIQVKKGKILFGGVEVGDLLPTGTDSNAGLQVNFNAAATGDAIRAVVRSIAFSSRKNRGQQLPRTAYVSYYDQVNQHFHEAQRQINVVGKG